MDGWVDGAGGAFIFGSALALSAWFNGLKRRGDGGDGGQIRCRLLLLPSTVGNETLAKVTQITCRNEEGGGGGGVEWCRE